LATDSRTFADRSRSKCGCVPDQRDTIKAVLDFHSTVERELDGGELARVFLVATRVLGGASPCLVPDQVTRDPAMDHGADRSALGTTRTGRIRPLADRTTPPQRCCNALLQRWPVASTSPLHT
jgi:hypothetical protein